MKINQNFGIINTGDYCHNTIDYSFSELETELNQLLAYSDQKELIQKAIAYTKEKNPNGLKECIMKFTGETIAIVKKLSLSILESFIKKSLGL